MALLTPYGGQAVAYSGATTAASARTDALGALTTLLPSLTAAEQQAQTDYATPGTRPTFLDPKTWAEIRDNNGHRSGRTPVAAFVVPVHPDLASRALKALQGIAG